MVQVKEILCCTTLYVVSQIRHDGHIMLSTVTQSKQTSTDNHGRFWNYICLYWLIIFNLALKVSGRDAIGIIQKSTTIF